MISHVKINMFFAFLHLTCQLGLFSTEYQHFYVSDEVVCNALNSDYKQSINIKAVTEY